MKQGLLAAGALTLGMALGGCGDDEKKSASSSPPVQKAAAAPALDTVLSCLKGEGLEAKDQSNSGGEVIGIDYPAGRLVISFKESAEDAETYASVAEANGYTAFVKGTLAITIPADPAAESARPAVEGCVS
jgi:hypothetical protein